MMQQQHSSLESILLDNNNMIRVYKNPSNGITYYSAFDIMKWVIPGCNPRQRFVTLVHMYPEFGQPADRNGDDALNLPAVEDYLVTMYHFTPQRGGLPTPTVDFDGAVRLIMVLPGAGAAEYRKRFADILTRGIAGDESLVNEIRANGKSDAALPSMAREHLKTVSTGCTMVEPEPAPKRQRVSDLPLCEQLSIVKQLEAMIGDAMDEYTAQKLKEWGKNALHEEVMGKVASITDGKASSTVTQAVADAEPITISAMARQLGFTKVMTGDQLRAVGVLASKAYRERYGGQDVPKKSQYVQGAYREVNAYTMRDADIVEKAIRSVLGTAPAPAGTTTATVTIKTAFAPTTHA